MSENPHRWVPIDDHLRWWGSKIPKMGTLKLAGQCHCFCCLVSLVSQYISVDLSIAVLVDLCPNVCCKIYSWYLQSCIGWIHTLILSCRLSRHNLSTRLFTSLSRLLSGLGHTPLCLNKGFFQFCWITPYFQVPNPDIRINIHTYHWLSFSDIP